MQSGTAITNHLGFKVMQKRCYICSSSFKRDGDKVDCQCGVKVHELCASDEVYCPRCGRYLIPITDAGETLGG